MISFANLKILHRAFDKISKISIDRKFPTFTRIFPQFIKIEYYSQIFPTFTKIFSQKVKKKTLKILTYKYKTNILNLVF